MAIPYRGRFNGAKKDLLGELAKREGVKEFVLDHPGSHASLRVNTISEGYTEFIEGPAKILVSID